MQALQRAARVARWLALAMVIPLAVAGGLAAIVLPNVLGQEFAGAVDAFRIYCVGMVPAVANAQLSVGLQGVGYEKQSGMAVMVGSSTGIAIMYVGSQFGGAAGAATGFVAAQVIILVWLSFLQIAARR